MKILVEIGHPAHTHFFRPVLQRLKERGDETVVVTRNKEITDRLLEEMGIPFVRLSNPSRTLIGLAAELFYRWFRIWQLIRSEQVNIVVSISGISTAFPAYLRGTPSITLSDTEDAALSNRLAFPFSTSIMTPQFFLHSLGPRHSRYNGLHELAYLRSMDHEHLKGLREELKLPQRYSVIRLISYDALHDRGLARSKIDDVLALAKYLSKFGAVYVTSQEEIPSPLREYRLTTPLAQIHAVLAGATVFVGESPTMAVESSLLGTPAVLVSERFEHLGNMLGLEKEGLLKNVNSIDEAMRFLNSLGDPYQYKAVWGERAREFCAQSQDVVQVLMHEIERITTGPKC